MIRARLRGAGPERDACILDVSTRGLAATMVNPPPRGDYVELIIGDFMLVGQVKWSSPRRFGVTFRERISVIAMLSGDSGPVTLKRRKTEQKRAIRSRTSGAADGIKRKMELAAILAAGVVAASVLADYADTALSSLDSAKMALAGKRVG